MTAKQFLLNDNRINLSAVAKLMWAGKDGASIYLHNKLKGKRPWTEKDEANAINALRDLSVDISKIDGIK